MNKQGQHQSSTTQKKVSKNENNLSNSPGHVQPPPPPSPDKLPSRKIPDTLIQSYDLVSLKEEKKKRFQMKKINTIEEQQKNNYSEKLLQIQGQCFCKIQNEEEVKAVYRLTPGLIVISKICHIKIKQITKIKLKNNESEDEKSKVDQPKGKIVKVTWEEDQEEYNILIKTDSWLQSYYLFSAIITRKLLIDQFVLHDCSNILHEIQKSPTKIEGDYFTLNCLKISTQVSNYFRKWEKKKVKITKQGIDFIKDQKTVSSIRNMKQLWTRFTMHNGYFTVKMHHGMEKTQIGIPLVDFTNIESEKNCLFLLSRLIK